MNSFLVLSLFVQIFNCNSGGGPNTNLPNVCNTSVSTTNPINPDFYEIAIDKWKCTEPNWIAINSTQKPLLVDFSYTNTTGELLC